MHSIVMCRDCMAGAYDRFSAHVCFVVRCDHLREPLRDVNAEADAILAEYARAETEKRETEAREMERLWAEEEEAIRGRKHCSMQ